MSTQLRSFERAPKRFARAVSLVLAGALAVAITAVVAFAQPTQAAAGPVSSLVRAHAVSVRPVVDAGVDTSAPAQLWSISITATGRQAALDRCVWVRMDFDGVPAPIVGAHNRCGGDIILSMTVGDLVTVHGKSLDGQYFVIGTRDVLAGSSAKVATSNYPAAAYLLTCYYNGNGKERLLALQKFHDSNLGANQS